MAKKPERVILYIWRHLSGRGFHLDFAGHQPDPGHVVPPPASLVMASRDCPAHSQERHLALLSVEMTKGLAGLLDMIAAIRPRRYMPEVEEPERVDPMMGTPEQRNLLAIERAARKVLALQVQWDPETMREVEDAMRTLPAAELARRNPFNRASYGVLLMGWAKKFRQDVPNSSQAAENERRAGCELRAVVRWAAG